MSINTARLSAAERPPLIAGIDHLLIVRALILRDLRSRYRGNPFGVLSEYFRLVIVIVAHYVFFSVTDKEMPANVPIEIFVIAAFSIWFGFSRTVTAAESGAKWPARASQIPGITRMHFRLAKSAWSVLSNLFFCLFCALLLRLYGDEVNLPDVPLTVLLFAIVAGLAFGFGLLVEALERHWPLVQPLEKIVIWVLFVSCGIYFSESNTTPILGEVFWFNPLLHLVEYQRHAFDPGYPVALLDLSYPATCAAGLIFFGLLLNQWIRDRHHG